MSKNILWNTIGSVFYSACQWVITIIVVHVASYEMAGYLSLAMTTSSSFSAISLFSMRNFQVSDVRGEYTSSQYVSSRIWTCIVAFVLCVVVSGIGNSQYQILCIMAFMLIRVSEALVDVMHGIDQKQERYDYIGISYLIRGAITVVVFTAGLALTNNMVLTLFLIAAMTLLVAILFDFQKAKTLETFRVDCKDKQILRLIAQCIPLVVFTFLLSMENLIPKDILQYYFDTETLGIYSSIASPTLVVQVCASVIFNPFIPRLSNEYYADNISMFKKHLHQIYGMLVLMCVIVCVGAGVLGRWGLSLLFGTDILEYYNLFMPIVICTLCTGIVWILSAVVILMRKVKELLWGIIISFVICIALSLPWIRTMGANAVSLVQIVSLSVLIVIMIVICEYTIKRKETQSE